MNATTDEVESDASRARIDGLNKEKKAPEESKKNNQVRHRRVKPISTYLSGAGIRRIDTGDPSSFPATIA